MQLIGFEKIQSSSTLLSTRKPALSRSKSRNTRYCPSLKQQQSSVRAAAASDKNNKFSDEQKTSSSSTFGSALDRLDQLAADDEAQEQQQLEADIANLDAQEGQFVAFQEGDGDDEALVDYGDEDDYDLPEGDLDEDALPVYYADDTSGAALEEKAGGKKAARRLRRGHTRIKQRFASLPPELLPKVAIVGRPNVGKSALFNRIVGRQVAIVFDYPGVTRDRLYTRANWGNTDFMLIDTGGLMSAASQLPKDQQAAAARAISAAGLPSAIERQAAAALDDADAIIMVVDGQTGPTATDEEVLNWLRRTHPDLPLLLAVNKCENVAKAELQAADFWEWGVEPLPVSAISGTGTGDLLERLMPLLPTPPLPEELPDEDEERPIAVAIVGRPNVGKSSLLNALLGQERAIVSNMAGTTRDAIDTDLTTPDGRQFTLIDTAGVRKRAAVAGTKDGAEPLMVERAFRAVKRSDVVVLVIDAAEGITQQDYRIAEYAANEGRACVVVVNKWDLIPNKVDSTLSDFETNVRSQLRPVEWANIVFVSAKTGQRVKRVLDATIAAVEEHRRRVTTATLNLVIGDATGWRSPPSNPSGKRGRIYYGTQAGTRPPSFVLFCNDPKLFGDDYRKYIERQFRENIGFPGTPVRLFWRGKPGTEK